MSPTYELPPGFAREYARLSREQRRDFREAVSKLIVPLRPAATRPAQAAGRDEPGGPTADDDGCFGGGRVHLGRIMPTRRNSMPICDTARVRWPRGGDERGDPSCIGSPGSRPRCCSCTRAGRSGRRRTSGPGRSRRGSPTTGEDLRDCALREMGEELGSRLRLARATTLVELGTVRQKGGKVVHGWAAEADFDPASAAQQHIRDRVAAALRRRARVPGGRSGRVVRPGARQAEDHRRPGRLRRPPARSS